MTNLASCLTQELYIHTDTNIFSSVFFVMEVILMVGGCLAGPSASAQPSEGGSPQHFEVNHRIGPAAAKLLRESGLRANAIKPTGPHNMVTKGDVLAAMESGLTAPPKPQVPPLVLSPSFPLSFCI